MTAIILAGGKASRMGVRDKAFLKIDNEPIINRQLKLLKKVFKKIIIVSNSPARYRRLRGIKLIPDIIPNLGPLGGIFSGLLASEDDYNLVVACDMPSINLELIKYMYKKAAGFDIVMPKVKERCQPLCALYSKGCIATIKEALDKENLRIVDILPLLNVKLIDESEIKRFDPEFISFININTKEDYEAVRS